MEARESGRGTVYDLCGWRWVQWVSAKGKEEGKDESKNLKKSKITTEEGRRRESTPNVIGVALCLGNFMFSIGMSRGKGETSQPTLFLFCIQGQG